MIIRFCVFVEIIYLLWLCLAAVSSGFWCAVVCFVAPLWCGVVCCWVLKRMELLCIKQWISGLLPTLDILTANKRRTENFIVGYIQ